MTGTTADDDFHLVGWLLVTDDDGRILLGRRDGVTSAGLWGPPGGHLDAGESFLTAAVREAREEVGVVADPRDVRPRGVQHYDDHGVRGLSVFFTTNVWQGEPAPVSECSEVGWFDPLDLPADTLPWLPPVLRSFEAGRWFDELGLA